MIDLTRHGFEVAGRAPAAVAPSRLESDEFMKLSSDVLSRVLKLKAFATSLENHMYRYQFKLEGCNDEIKGTVALARSGTNKVMKEQDTDAEVTVIVVLAVTRRHYESIENVPVKSALIGKAIEKALHACCRAEIAESMFVEKRNAMLAVEAGAI